MSFDFKFHCNISTKYPTNLIDIWESTYYFNDTMDFDYSTYDPKQKYKKQWYGLEYFKRIKDIIYEV